MEKEYPIQLTIEFTEDEWTTCYTGRIMQESVCSYLIYGHNYGIFWIPKCYVRIKKDLTESVS